MQNDNLKNNTPTDANNVLADSANRLANLKLELDKLSDDERYELISDLRKAFVSGELPLTEVAKCGKCEMLGDAAPCDECYRNGNYH